MGFLPTTPKVGPANRSRTETVKRTPQQPVPVRHLLGSANAETTPSGTQPAAADRTQRPDAAREGKNGRLSRTRKETATRRNVPQGAEVDRAIYGHLHNGTLYPSHCRFWLLGARTPWCLGQLCVPLGPHDSGVRSMTAELGDFLKGVSGWTGRGLHSIHTSKDLTLR